MRDPLKRNVRAERKDVFIFRGYVHGAYAYGMHVRVFEEPLSPYSANVLIEKCDREEPSAVAALKGCANLYHPVDHLGPIVVSDLVPIEGLEVGIKLLFLLLKEAV